MPELSASSFDNNINLRRRTLLKTSLAAMGVLVAAGGYLAVREADRDEGSLVLQLGWLPGSAQVGEIVAQHKGFFQDQGIDFRISAGGPSIDGVSLVSSGSATVGEVASTPSIMLAVSQWIPIRCFAVALQRHPYCFFSLKRNPVRSIGDMRHKRVGVQASSEVLLWAALAKGGLARDSVHIVPIAADLTPLLTGQVDVITGWLTDAAALKALGADRVDLELWDTGVRLYALPYYASHVTLEKNFDLVARFLRGAARGWHYARKHLDEAAAYVVGDYPSLRFEDQRISIERLMTFAFDKHTDEAGWGTMDRLLWTEQIRTYNQLGQFTNHTPSVDEVMTMRVLDATQSDRLRS